MPFIKNRDARKIIAEVSPEDGDGFVVRHHWTQWLAYWIVVPPVVIGTISATVVLLVKGYLLVFSWWFLAWLGVSLYILSHVAYLWYRSLARTVVIVFPLVVYQQRVQKLFDLTIRWVNASEIGPAETISESYIFRGKRTLLISTKGSTPDIEFKHAGGGEDMEAGVKHILSKHPESPTPT